MTLRLVPDRPHVAAAQETLSISSGCIGFSAPFSLWNLITDTKKVAALVKTSHLLFQAVKTSRCGKIEKALFWHRQHVRPLRARSLPTTLSCRLCKHSMFFSHASIFHPCIIRCAVRPGKLAGCWTISPRRFSLGRAFLPQARTKTEGSLEYP